MDLLSLRLFVRIAERGALSAAARDLSLSPASASARLMKLEREIGCRLFNRTTRAVSLTTDGDVFLPHAEQILETLDIALSELGDHGGSAKGVLRMTMPASFGRMHVLPTLAEFRERHPLIRLDLRLSDEVLDVVEGAYDLIIRNARLPDSSLVSRRLAADRRLLVAAPAYLERHGVPGTPQALTEHRCVVLGENARWKFEDGATVTVPRSVVVNDGEAVRTLLEDGMGIGVSSVWNASRSLRDGRLVEVLPASPLVTETSIWALYPGRRTVAPKVRVMIDFLLERFGSVPPWERAEEAVTR